MLKFKFFNKDKFEEVNVKVESDNKTIDKIKEEAEDESNKIRISKYNDTVIDNIKEKLILQYSIDTGPHINMLSIYHGERLLVEAICKDIAKEMNLLK